MNWIDWVIFLLVALVPLIVWSIATCVKRRKAKKESQLVSRIATIQSAYVLTPQYNPAYQSQHVYPQESFGWNVTNLDQLGVVNVTTTPEGILVVPREPMQCTQQTIWSVSGQMNHENSTDNQRWPTHNSNVSVDSFILTESARMQQKDRVPPPPYSEIELPSYEQAVCMTAPKSNTPAVHAASSSRTNQDPSPS
ncbi:uncharacterized protein LOC116160122 isoform X2 [Photinus pyralis]|uniref:uncharacterized protein LOC116160122 isoform X2 n=1 Tax=Photinus pyralis TaxID=7054 RepID=UPI001266FA44|nr:uncharacterized protein LOC116160122 isoform X2 [Photinus pyralis]